MGKTTNKLFSFLEGENKCYIKETVRHHKYIDRYSMTYSVFKENKFGIDELIDDGLSSLDYAKLTIKKYKERINTVGEKIMRDIDV